MREVDEPGTPPANTPPASRESAPDGPHPRPALSWLALGATLLILVLLARTLVAYPLVPLRFSLGIPAVAPTPTLATIQQDSGVPGLTLQNVVMASKTDGWATGWQSGSDGSFQPELLYWNGSTWTSVANLPGDGSVTAIAALPSGDVWAAAGNTIFHLMGDVWVPVYVGENDTSYAEITSLDMLTPSEGWATGILGDATGQQSFILRYHAGDWLQQQTPLLPETNTLRSLSMSADGQEGWAVGSLYTGAGEASLALHYLNGAWIEEDAGLPGGASSVATVSAGDAWAVGIIGGVGPGYIAHWQFNTWQLVASPTTNQLHAIAMLSPDEGWIAGDGAATLHYVNGAWQREGLVIHGTLLSGIAMTAPGEGWAVGGAVMLREHNGIWNIYKLSL